MDATSSVRRGDPMRALPSGLLRCNKKKLRGVINGYVKITITHLKTVAAILQYTTPHDRVGTHLRLFLVGRLL